jgi:hypothetical protein
MLHQLFHNDIKIGRKFNSNTNRNKFLTIFLISLEVQITIL